MANGLAGKEKRSLGFPEEGQRDYLEATMELGMWRRVSAATYQPVRISALLETAEAKAKSFYSHGLYSLETLAKANS